MVGAKTHRQVDIRLRRDPFCDDEERFRVNRSEDPGSDPGVMGEILLRGLRLGLARRLSTALVALPYYRGTSETIAANARCTIREVLADPG